MPSKLDQILSFVDKRAGLIDAIIARLEGRVTASQSSLRKAVESFLEQLEQDEDGSIKITLANKRKLNLLDRAYDGWIADSGVSIIQEIVTGVNDLHDFNTNYYGIFTGKAQLADIMASTKEQIGDWLGITTRGKLVENGYLNRLLSDDTIRNQVRNSTFASIVSQKGFFETKKELAIYIEGNKEKTGALQRYYSGFIYDTFSTVDRTQNKIIADKLKLQYAIYEGGLVKDSRTFCRQHNGKVYTTDEIAEFDPQESVPPNYDPFTMLGGYRCRHHLNYIPASLAFILRPELKKMVA